MDMQALSIVLSDEQLSQIEQSAYQATIRGITRANEQKGLKTWMKRSDLPNYLPFSDSSIDINLKDLPYHLVGATKFYNRHEVDEFILNKK